MKFEQKYEIAFIYFSLYCSIKIKEEPKNLQMYILSYKGVLDSVLLLEDSSYFGSVCIVNA